jgi:outer membrane protein
MQQLQNSLQAPIYEKAQNVINALAKGKGVAAVFEKGTFLYLDPAQLVDLTPDARVALGIPEDRTIESLQAELEAKAQAAQMQ